MFSWICFGSSGSRHGVRISKYSWQGCFEDEVLKHYKVTQRPETLNPKPLNPRSPKDFWVARAALTTPKPWDLGIEVQEQKVQKFNCSEMVPKV